MAAAGPNIYSHATLLQTRRGSLGLKETPPLSVLKAQEDLL
jgi:hypothetical protein